MVEIVDRQKQNENLQKMHENEKQKTSKQKIGDMNGVIRKWHVFPLTRNNK